MRTGVRYRSGAVNPRELKPGMLSITSIYAMQAFAREAGATGRRIGLVPTMGALHEGHLSLVRAARRDQDLVVVSLFVNPLQFGPAEDLSRYPRDPEGDARKLADEQVNVLFAPAAEEVYRAGFQTFVEVEEIGKHLDGASRPGHFRGVATVVAKLFNAVLPQAAYFGQKDAAQVAVIRRLIQDLNFPVELKVCPIVREPDGLAMSSRNAYLDAAERAAATVLYRSLEAAAVEFRHGERSAGALRDTLLRTLSAEPRARVDYAEIVDPDSLLRLETVQGPALAAVAAWIGSTRLIDNVLLMD